MSKRISQLTSAATLAGTELVEVSKLSATVTKTATTISADSTDNSYNDSANGFVTAGFTTGKTIKVSGFTGNVANNITSGVVTSVAAGKIIVGGTDGDVIVTDAAGESVTITQWDSMRSTAQDIAGLASAVTIKDEGTNLTTALSSIDFVGAGVTATTSGANVTVTIPGSVGREILSAARTYYVRTDGSNSNNGLANTSGGAFLTIQKAVDVVCDTLDLAGFAVTIQVADGTYTGAVTLKPLPNNGSCVIQGNSGTPANVLISTTSASCFSSGGSVVQAAGVKYTIKDMKLQTTTSGRGIISQNGAVIVFTNIVFGTCVNEHLYVDRLGVITSSGNYSITGGASAHMQANLGGLIANSGKTITITGTPAFVTAFAIGNMCGVISLSSNSYSGSATGKYYDVQLNAVVQSGVTLPGNAAGTTATGGQYA